MGGNKDVDRRETTRHDASARHAGARTGSDRGQSRSPRPVRTLTIVSAVLANTLAFLAIAYFFVDQTDLPDFFPHASSASDAATDIPMGFVLLGLAGLAAYAAVQSHLHRSWMRTRRWHRKHGRW